MKRVLSLFIVLGFLVSTRGSFAEDLILEFDPDESTGDTVYTDLTDEIVDDSGQVFADKSGQNQQYDPRLGYIQGYRQLFGYNQDEISGLEAVLLPVQKDIYDLETQLQVLELQIERVRKQKQLLGEKIGGLNDLNEKLKVQEKLLKLELKGLLEKFQKIMLMFYRVKRQYVQENGQVNLVQLFSTARFPADLIFQDYLLQKVQDQFMTLIAIVYNDQAKLDQTKVELRLVERQLIEYQDNINESEQVLSQQADYKQILLADRLGEQKFFSRALAEAKLEQEQIMIRVRELATGISYKDYSDFPREDFIWPVAPALGISSFFHDKSYESKFGITHNAIDIPTDQLTPVMAPLSGQVIEARDGGLGYSYLQLAHKDGLSTVYGHIYSLKAQKGDMVEQGEIIALSGGALGTRGAGTMTTGPHLHLEILKDGVYVDPLEYLPDLE